MMVAEFLEHSMTFRHPKGTLEWLKSAKTQKKGQSY